MIKIPKKQLFNFPAFLSYCSLLLLAVLFLLALRVDTRLFFVIAVVQVVIAVYFLIRRQRLMEDLSEISLAAQDDAEKTNLLQAEIANDLFAVEAWQEKIKRYHQLKDLTEKFSLCLSLGDTSKEISQGIGQFFTQKDVTAILYLVDAQTGELAIAASRKGEEAINIKLKQGDLFDKWVMKILQPLLVEDVKSDFRFDADRLSAEERRPIQSLISAPLMIDSKPVGILRLDSEKENTFTTEDLRMLKTISDLGALAVENAQLFEKVEELAIRDSLTGLYLRRHFLSRLNEEINRQFRRKKPLSLLMLDLDKFKIYNDKYGHMAGDIVLKTIGLILQDNFKEPGELACRYGGEEFVVILPDRDKTQAAQMAEDIRKRIKKQEIILRNKLTHISVSIGVAAFPEDAQVKEELIHAADQAMYKAKSKGRDQVCTF